MNLFAANFPYLLPRSHQRKSLKISHIWDTYRNFHYDKNPHSLTRFEFRRGDRLSKSPSSKWSISKWPILRNNRCRERINFEVTNFAKGPFSKWFISKWFVSKWSISKWTISRKHRFRNESFRDDLNFANWPISEMIDLLLTHLAKIQSDSRSDRFRSVEFSEVSHFWSVRFRSELFSEVTFRSHYFCRITHNQNRTS